MSHTQRVVCDSANSLAHGQKMEVLSHPELLQCISERVLRSQLPLSLTDQHKETDAEPLKIRMRAVFKVRGLAAVRRCYAEGGGDIAPSRNFVEVR
jgi:hypothetical protein